MTLSKFNEIKSGVIQRGHGGDIEWSETIKPVADADDFFGEYCFVVCNSGMKFSIAQVIFERVMNRVYSGGKAGEVFGHKGKSAAIDKVYANRHEFLSAYTNATDKLACLESIPWIGKITKYHLAKNFGHDCAKPDRHLVRIATAYGETPDSLCKRLARETGLRIATVDVVLWRAAAIGVDVYPPAQSQNGHKERESV